MKVFLQATLALMLMAGLFMPSATTQALDTTHLVTPLSTDWAFVDDNAAGNAVTGFENGSGTPPLGEGSFYIELNSSTAGYTMSTQKYQGTPLSEITTLSYSTYTNLSPAAMSFQINYDPDLTSAIDPKPWYGRLTYEPYMNGTVTNNTWQTWDMLNSGAGKWWASPNANSAVDNTCPQAAPCTLTDLLAAFPNIGIRNDAGSAIHFKAGSNWNGFAGNVDNFTIEIGGDTDTYNFEPLSEIHVDDDWASVTPGDDPDGAGPATKFGTDSFAVIQDGIDAVVNNGTVNIHAGTYVEELLINKPLSLLGPNDTINPNTGTRAAEAVIHPANIGVDPYNTCTVMAYIEVSGVTIKGLTFDGDNPSLTSGVAIGTADVDTCEIIAGYEGVGSITIENNILEHSTYSAIDLYNYTNTAATSDNYIRYNLIRNIGETIYNWGVGILVYNNFYADITDNVLDNVRIGMQTGNYYQANPGTTGSISNNIINTWRVGIFHNLWYSNASTIPVSNNTITAIDSAGSNKWNGILISSFGGTSNTTISDNTINIGTITQNPAAGYSAWNTTTSAALTISGGTVSGGNYGVWVNNYEGYSSNAGNTSITIDGVTISDAATAGIYVLDSASNTNGSTVHANIQNSEITNSTTGILVAGSDATAVANFNKIYENATAGITNTSGNVMNAENNLWGSNEGPEDANGSVELPFNPEPAVADMLNAAPLGSLGNAVSDDVDYHPWGTNPVVLSVTLASPNPASDSSVDFTFTFSEAVSNVDVTDFDLVATGVSGASITGVSGTDNVFTVSVNTGSGNGTLRLDVPNTATVVNSASNPLIDLPFTSGEEYTLIKTPTFSDVPTTHPYWRDIEILSANGLTAGCSTFPFLGFCPEVIMNRAESAVFVLRGSFGNSYTPPSAPWNTFADNWAQGTWAEKWAEGMYDEGLTAGCATNPLRFCPWDKISREQAAVFGLKLKYGNAYLPPPATGTVFADMTDPNYWATKWAEQAYADGLLPSCGTDIGTGKPNFCTTSLVNRGLAAYMIVQAKNLTMP